MLRPASAHKTAALGLTPRLGARGWLSVGLLALIGGGGVVAHFAGAPFYVDLATRLVCLAIAATSLNLILGYGGLLSFGHAVFIGIGAYAVGIPSYHATYGDWQAIASYNGFFHLALAMGLSGLFALVTGAISLRTRGVHFIMITMAFAQMMFFFFVSLEAYGGDDGLTIDVRSELGPLSLDDPLQMFLLAFGVLLATLWLVDRLVHSRFGLVLQGAKDNDERMRMIGFNTYVFRLVAYVIAGALCGLAGALLGNFTAFVSPDMLDWTRSGELMFMVILGGAGTLLGPILGATIFVVLEELLSGLTIYWHLPFGALLILSVLFARGGLMAFVGRLGGND